jgi:hypothetical protein
MVMKAAGQTIIYLYRYDHHFPNMRSEDLAKCFFLQCILKRKTSFECYLLFKEIYESEATL